MPDPVQVIVDLLTDNWNSDNTDGLTPSIFASHDVKREDARGDRSVIRCYQSAPHSTDFVGLGTADETTNDQISVDIFTMKDPGGRAHSVKLHTEVKRILDAVIINPDSDYQHLKPVRLTDLCNRSKRLYHWVWDVQLINIAKAR